MTKYTPAVRRAIKTYGEQACVRAYEINTKQGEGAHTISIAYALPGVNTTRQADSAINAGCAIVKARAAAQAAHAPGSVCPDCGERYGY
jgi:hypothetical protein